MQVAPVYLIRLISKYFDLFYSLIIDIHNFILVTNLN